MIVVQVTDPYLRNAVFRAARPDEDVVSEDGHSTEAIEWGFPRLVVREVGPRYAALPPVVGLLEIDETTLNRWEAERRAEELPPTRLDHLTERLRSVIEGSAVTATSVDRTLADLSRAAGSRLPFPLTCFGRRVLEYPIRYRTLQHMAHACGASRGALKARFRRRGLPSPSTYLRWFRIIAVADLLSDRSLTIATAARRLGFTSDGNLCRMMSTVTGMTPTEVRTVHGWNRLLVTFAWQQLTPQALEGWASLDELFARRVA